MVEGCKRDVLQKLSAKIHCINCLINHAEYMTSELSKLDIFDYDGELCLSEETLTVWETVRGK